MKMTVARTLPVMTSTMIDLHEIVV
jgi:hypothetical protein